jgi:hypothetical protein
MKRRPTTIELSSKANKDDFRRMKSVLSCVSNDPTRPVLHHVLVEAGEESIQIIATDGRRLRSDRFDMEVSPGLYEIKANTARGIYLVKSRSRMTFPNHRQVIPSLKPKNTHQLTGRGRKFVLWASAALGCRLDPALIELAEDEPATLYIQKQGPGLSPAVVQNDQTTLVVMPTRCTEDWAREVEEIRKAA